MTQYPSTPPPYGYGYDPYQQQQSDALAPARRAALMMFLLAGMMLLCGVCVGAFAMTVPMERLLQESGITLPQQPPPGMSVGELMRIGYMVIAVGSLLAGIIVVVLGVFVRRGGMGAAVASIVVVSLMLLVAGLSVVVSLPQMAQQPSAILGICVVLVPVALMVGALITLVQAAKAASSVNAMKQQYQFQTWQYQQQQQAYNQGGYAMPQPPPGQPPAPAPPQQSGEDVPR
jgi:hypothetical protein